MSNFLRSARRLALRAAVLPALAVSFVACDDDDTVTAPEEIAANIVEIAATNPTLTTLVTALTEADLVATLQGPGPFTVFAPINSAFSALPAGQLDYLLDPANIDDLVALLQSHVVAGAITSDQLSDGQTVTTLSGQVLTVGVNGGVTINGNPVVSADVEGSNGVIHFIGGVITPELATIAGTAAASDDLSTLVTALQAADLVDALNGSGSFTVFAPTNTAFGALDADVLGKLLEEGNVDLLTKVLTYHVVDGAAYSQALTDGQTLTTLQGQELAIGVNGGTVTVNGATVTTANIGASNGVVHIVDGVLVPEFDVVETARLNDAFSTLVEAVVAAELGETLSGAGPFTVFAPINDAFGAVDGYTLDQLLDPANIDILRKVLTFHVVPGEVLAGDLTDGGTAITVQGQELAFDLSGATPQVNGVNIIDTDIPVENGVIHVVDGVILPQFDIVETAILTESTGTLVTAVAAGELVETLQGEGPFTVFAPINEAFAALGTDRLDVVLDPANQALLQKILTYHVVPGAVLSSQLQDGGTATTVEGTDLVFDLSGTTPQVNGINIIATDVVTENGVIHLIDGVLTQNLDIVDVATLEGFPTLVSLVETAGLTDALRGDGPSQNGLTVFAPTEDAFAALAAVPEGDALANVLLYHVVDGTVPSTALSDGQVVNPLLENSSFTVNIDGTVTITDGTGNTVTVLLTDVAAANGVIHVIDAVKLPGN